MKEFFRVSASIYDADKNYDVVRPASVVNPHDNSIMFITKGFMKYSKNFMNVKECIIIWPTDVEVPEEISNKHTIIKSDNPRKSYAFFYRDNNITYLPKLRKYTVENGAYIAEGAIIGEGTEVFPGAYIDAEVTIGNNCYIGSGVKLMGNISIGNDVVIRENTVIGSDGLTRQRDDNGKIATIPQFGGVIIGDNVQIGALSVIAKGAIDDTIISSGCRIDNCTFISHNVRVAEDSIIVGETIMFGSSSTGEQAFISGNSTIRDGIHVGEKSFVGMGAVVVHDVPDEAVVKGNPAE